MNDKRNKTREIVKELKKLFPTSKTFLFYATPWELTVAVILSARNTDKKVNEVTKNLFKKYKTIKDCRIRSKDRLFTKPSIQDTLSHGFRGYCIE